METQDLQEEKSLLIRMEELTVVVLFWKDPSKVDRSAAYATRHIAKNLVAAGVADEILVQVSYAIVSKPMGIFIDTYGTSKLNLTNGEIKKVEAIFDMRPYFIEQRLRNPIYSETAAYGHMGTPETVTKTFSRWHQKTLRLNYLHGKN
jgi:S-adenosylmethionine synthetase